MFLYEMISTIVHYHMMSTQTTAGRQGFADDGFNFRAVFDTIDTPIAFAATQFFGVFETSLRFN